MPDAGHDTNWEYWRRLLGHRNTWALCLMYLPNSFAFYFCITWLPKYLKVQHGFESVTLGIVAGLPLTLSVLGDLFGGVATDWVTARFGLRAGRSGVGAAAYLLAGVSMFLAATTREPMPGRRVDLRGRGREHVHRWPPPGEPASTWAEITPAW